MHVWGNDHGVCSTLGHVLHNVFHRDWGRETVSKRHRVPSRRNGHVLAKKGNVLPPPTLHSGTPIFSASPTLLVSNIGTRNGVVFESHEMPRYRCILDVVRSHFASDRK